MPTLIGLNTQIYIKKLIFRFLISFEKGEYISHQDHPDMIGVIYVVSGNAFLKDYTVEKQLDEQIKIIEDGKVILKKRVLLKEIKNEFANEGDVRILTSHDGNIHSIMPNEFTQLFDVFTPAYKSGTKTIWYKVNQDGFDKNRTNIFEAEYNVPK